MAVSPPAAVADDIGRITAGWSDGDGWTVETPRRLHATLRFLGVVPVIEPIASALRQMSTEAAPLTVTYGPATVLLTPQAVVVPLTGLTGFAERVREVLEPWGDSPAPRPFFGHLTVARIRRPARDGSPIPRSWVGVPVRGGWPVEAVRLFASETVAGTPHYRVVEEFPLAG